MLPALSKSARNRSRLIGLANPQLLEESRSEIVDAPGPPPLIDVEIRRKPAGLQHDDPIGQLDRFVHVMSDK